MYDLTLGGRARCLAVWLLASAAAAVAVLLAAPDLVNGITALRSGRLSTWPFDRVLVLLAAVALIACATWAWIVTGIVVAQALAGRPRAQAPGVPRWLCRAVLMACGLAVIGAGGAAHAQDREGDGARVDRGVLAGLPPPERVLGAVRPSAEPGPEPTQVHVVRPGDTLWDIAAQDLDDTAGGARIADHWHRIYRLNRALIGADPDLIRPGQELRLPAPPTE